MSEFTPLPSEFNMAVGEYTMPQDIAIDIPADNSQTNSSSTTASNWRTSVKKLLATGLAVAATSWGVIGGASGIGRTLVRPKPTPASVISVITPGDAAEPWGSVDEIFQAIPEPSENPETPGSPETSASPDAPETALQSLYGAPIIFHTST